MVLNFGPPMIDFSPLGKLGETYDRSRERTRRADIETARTEALSSFGQNGDLASLGQTLLRAGDLEGGMQALRLHAANTGTPWQRERAAAEDERANRTLEIAERERQKAEERYREGLTRADRPTRVSEDSANEFGDKIVRKGTSYPAQGIIKWDDGTETRMAPGPQSGGAGDPNLPVGGGVPAQAAPGAVPPDYGYVIPGSLEYKPMGTVLPPKGGRATAVQAPPPMPPVAPPRAEVPAVAAQPTQAALAPPAGQVAVAQPVAATPPPGALAGAPVAGAPITATQINQGTSNIAPMSNAEMIAEARRLGISPGQYREARANAIKKEMEAKTTGGSAEATAAMKGKLAEARQRVVPIFKALDALEADVKEFGSQLVPGEEKSRMNVAATNIVMQLKDLYGLGALQQGDLQQIEKMISNPTADNPIEWGVKAIRHGMGTTTGEVKAIKKLVLERIQEAERHLGGDPNRVPEGVSPVTRQVERYDRDGNLVK